MGKETAPLTPKYSETADAYFARKMAAIKPAPLKQCLAIPVCAVCGQDIPPDTKAKTVPLDGVEYVCCPGCSFKEPDAKETHPDGTEQQGV